MAGPLILHAGFTEANGPHVIKRLCERYGLEESEANANVALKMLAVEAVRQGDLSAAIAAARAEPPPG